VPFLVYLAVSPVDGHRRRHAPPERPRLADLARVWRDLPRYPAILAMVVLQGAVGLLIGTAIMPLFPEFGELLGQDQSGLGYGFLIVAMSVGAVTGGIALETIGRLRPHPVLAVASELVFALCIVGFALSRWFPLSVAL